MITSSSLFSIVSQNQSAVVPGSALIKVLPLSTTTVIYSPQINRVSSASFLSTLKSPSTIRLEHRSNSSVILSPILSAKSPSVFLDALTTSKILSFQRLGTIFVQRSGGGAESPKSAQTIGQFY